MNQEKTVKPLPETHCLLSEFELPVFRWLGIARSKNAGWYLAMACMLWAALSIWFGHVIGANACGLELRATFSEQGQTSTGTLPLVWGWLAQINAGPFNLLVAPLLLLVTHRFLLACGEALKQLSASGRLTLANGSGSGWAEEMARRNRLCGLPLWSFPALLGICFYAQLSSIDRALQGYPTDHIAGPTGRAGWSDIGYSQSIGFENWARDFSSIKSTNSPGGVDMKLAILENKGWLSGLERALFDKMERKNLLAGSSLTNWLEYDAGRPVALRLRDFRSTTNLTIEVRALRPFLATNDSVPSWKKYAHGDRDPEAGFVSVYKLFIVFEQIQIAAFFTFGIWLTFKIVFWLFQVYRMLPANSSAQTESLRLEPLLDDPTGRYGLGALFHPYNLLVLTAAIGSSYIALKLPYGVRWKDIVSPDGVGSGATAVGHLVVITIVFVSIVCGPLWFFPKRLSVWAQERRLDRLYHELSLASHRKHRETLLNEEAKILRQTTWPSGDNSFKVTLAIILAVLLLPLGSALYFLPGEAISATRLPQVMREWCRDSVAKWYDLRPVEDREASTP